MAWFMGVAARNLTWLLVCGCRSQELELVGDKYVAYLIGAQVRDKQRLSNVR